MVIVSGGSAEANRSLDLHATVLLDKGSDLARACGAGATPSAVGVDRQGRVASRLAIGAQGVLDLIADACQTREVA